MAIYQISKIQNRKGLQADLPLLSGGELGWSVDERRLWIGNGSLQEGAPVLGNTEILTEFSDILNKPKLYTYRGDAAGYAVETGPRLNNPVRLNLQTWMDQWVSVKDFGAVGDGTTDDTAAINRALFQLYCIGFNPATRRALYFPAGKYLVTETINLPPYAHIYGEGPHSSMITLADWSSAPMVCQTVDSLGQIDEDMGNSGARMPTEITIHDIGIWSLDMSADIIRLNAVDGVHMENVAFIGAGDQANLNSDAFVKSAALRLMSANGVPTKNVRALDCQFYGTTWGVTTLHPTTGLECIAWKVIIDDSSFDTHYRGVMVGMGTASIWGTPNGFRITGCTFDEIYNEGVLIGPNSQNNATGYNVFYDVANHFLGVNSPQGYVIEIQSNNNISVGDLFLRDDDHSTAPTVAGATWPRVNINKTLSIAYSGTQRIEQGTFVRESGRVTTLLNGIAVPTPITLPTPGLPVTVQSVVGVDLSECQSFRVDYNMVRGTAYRTGYFMVASQGGGSVITDDQFTENTTLGVWMYAAQGGSLCYLTYESDNRGIPTTFSYSITYLA